MARRDRDCVRSRVGALSVVALLLAAPTLALAEGADATPAQLDARLPLSVAVYRHVHFCGWPNGTPRSDRDGAAARFGAGGSIASGEACAEAGGYWIPLVRGWMTHVYPFERIWLGDHAMERAELEQAKPDRGGHAEHHGHDGDRH